MATNDGDHHSGEEREADRREAPNGGEELQRGHRIEAGGPPHRDLERLAANEVKRL